MNAKFTVPQGQRIGAAVQKFEATGRNSGVQDDVRFRNLTGVIWSLAKITGHSGTFGAWIWALAIIDGSTANGYNSLDWNGTSPGMLVGSPGSQGINVGATGQVNSGTCLIQPFATTGGYMAVYVVDDRWTFTRDYSAQ